MHDGGYTSTYNEALETEQTPITSSNKHKKAHNLWAFLNSRLVQR